MTELNVSSHLLVFEVISLHMGVARILEKGFNTIEDSVGDFARVTACHYICCKQETEVKHPYISRVCMTYLFDYAIVDFHCVLLDIKSENLHGFHC